MSPILDVRNLRVTLATERGQLHAVRGIDLSVARGETLCLVGESGCGKSMTALSLMGLLPRSATLAADELRFDGQDLRGMPERAFSALRGSRMSMIFQEPMTALNPTFSIGDQLCAVYARHRKAGRQQAQERAVSLLEKVGISNARQRLGQYPHELSGGLRQRVLIAMALMCDPELIICDEPTTALDVTTQAQILTLLGDLQREFGMGMVFITHDLGVVSRIGDRICVMYAGRVVEAGDRRAIFGAPTHPYTRGLLASIPRPRRAGRQRRLGTIPGTVPSFMSPDALCPFRDRCAEATAICAEAPPPLREAGGGHRLWCHNAVPAPALQPVQGVS